MVQIIAWIRYPAGEDGRYFRLLLEGLELGSLDPHADVLSIRLHTAYHVYDKSRPTTDKTHILTP